MPLSSLNFRRNDSVAASPSISVLVVEKRAAAAAKRLRAATLVLTVVQAVADWAVQATERNVKAEVLNFILLLVTG